MLGFSLLVLVPVLLLAAGLTGAAPHVPKDDGVVLEFLPMRPLDATVVELRRLQAAHDAAPQDPAAAARLARRLFELANAEGDPRYVGYAEAALRPWRDAAAPPADVLLLRALLRQYRHDFPAALRDLEGVLRAEPDNVEARAWRSAIYMVQAEYAAAARECAALAAEAEALLAIGCAAYVDGSTGGARAAYARLAGALRDAPEAGTGARLWTLTRLAELAWRLGEAAAAERHFRAALALGRDDNFLLAAYADFLLQQGRPKEVVALLEKWERSDTLLLRLALAERALAAPAAERHIRILGERFAEARLRGERLHLQEEARYFLDLRGDAKAAIAAAAENYKTQREPRDAAVLLEAALAAGDRAAAAPALAWLDASGFESEPLRALAGRLRSADR